ncbi:MAG: Qat anti-phage system QueC-like protein QatC [Marmoricola sp.]
MTDYLLRTDPARSPLPDVKVLEWALKEPRATIDFGPEFVAGWRPGDTAGHLLVLAAGVYTVDKAEPRSQAPDAWTRTMGLTAPSSQPLTAFGKALNFLSGDHWTITADQPAKTGPFDTLPPLLIMDGELETADAVALFSGGLDSLCGAIDYLDGHPTKNLVLVSHYDHGKATSKQLVLFQSIAAQYPGRVAHRRLWLAAPNTNKKQLVPVLPTQETTTRGRSFLFICAAVALANAISPTTPVLVPENGYIALNVPLTRARTGSSSTRTTHPHFFELLNAALGTIGISNLVQNPYEFLTKGEMLAGSQNAELLEQLAPASVSCSHAEVARWVDGEQGNCGYCFPCLIRRASLAKVGWDDASAVWWDALSDGDLLTDVTSARGRDLRAVVNAVFADRPDADLLRNAPLPTGSRNDYLDVWRRGNAELKTWLTAGVTGPLATVVSKLT